MIATNLFTRKHKNFAREDIVAVLASHQPQSRENELRDRIPHSWPSSHENYFQSTPDSVSYCVVILRTPPYWSFRVSPCCFKLVRGFTFSSNPAQQAIRRVNLVLLSPTRQKVSTWKNLARVAANEQKRYWFARIARVSGSEWTKIAHCGLRYIST